MKKINFIRSIYGSLALFLFLFIASGCAKESPAPVTKTGETSNNQQTKQETIEFDYWAAAGGEEEGMKQMVADFEAKNPDIKVNAQQLPSPNTGSYYTKLQTRMAGNDAPDVFRVQYQKMGEFSSKKALLDVSGLFAKDKENFNKSLLTAVSYNDKIYGLPHHTDTLAVFYNKTYLDKLNIKVPNKLDQAWTWEQFIDVAKKLQDQKLATYGIAFNWKDSSAYRSLPFFFQNSASLLTNDMKKGNVETPEALDSLTFLQNMFKTYMSKGNSMKGTDDSNLLFTTGKAGLLVSGNWLIPKFEQEMKDYEWGVTYMPMKKSAASDLGGNALAIPANSKHPEAAKKFLAFLGQKENMKKFVELGLFLPGRTDITGDFNYKVKDKAMMNLFIEQSKTVPQDLAKTVTTTEFSKLNQALADALESMFMENVTPQKTAKTLNSNINEVLSGK
jgi:multiple sugar transport system substrate-binding protein